ncbi:Hpt domain-containing protein, partial [Skermanella aerolata]|uniref:Hpt domain-containing protein n=1 Tax=Skermanella aerolata TaxID=393310 RepID=UPI0005C9C1E0
MDDLLQEFLTETVESLSLLDTQLVRLEQNPNNPELLGNIFRLVHTIKGTCGFLGLPRLEHVAHASENVLGKFRDGELQVSPQAVSAILESLDTIKLILSVLEATEAEPPGDDSGLIARLNAIAEGRDVPAAAPAAPAVPAPVASKPDFVFEPVPAAREPAAAVPVPAASIPALPVVSTPEPEVPATIAAREP